jgi:hypothetical protein
MAVEKIDDKAVLTYLKAKRAALDQAIAALEGKVRGASATFGGSGSNEEIQSDSFVGMNIATASVKYLNMVGSPARTTEEVHNALTSGGLPNFTRASLATILQRAANQDRDIVRVRKGIWGLAEWYPNRPKRVKKKEKKRQKQPKSRQGKKANRPSSGPLAKVSQINTIAVKWLRMLREAGESGMSTAKLAAGLGYDSGRPLSFIASNINKKLAAAKIDPKTVYEGRRVGKEQRWFAKEKIGEGLKVLEA